jgi:hypothetical protein
MKNWISLVVLLLTLTTSNAQITDNFADGDYDTNPVWSGTASSWQVNSNFQLQSTNQVTNGSFYLSTQNGLATTVQWDVYVKLDFNPSGANFVDVYLISNQQDLTLSSSIQGYFVRIGNTNDEITLYRKNGNTETVIIDGANGILNNSTNTINLRVIRDAANQWQLLRDITGTGAAFVSEGSVTDATYTTSSYFGFLVKQSTPTFYNKHYFDDISVKSYTPDVIPPAITNAVVSSPNSVDIYFSEPVAQTAAQTLTNYTVNNGVGNPVTATRDASNFALVHLNFLNNFPNQVLLTLTANNIADLSGNILNNGTVQFMYAVAGPYSVVIDEIMADPSPPVSLPEVEWLELKNTSGFDINLQGWRLGKPSGLSGPLPSYLLKKDSFVIVCTSGSVPALLPLGKTISVTSFPSLSNSGDQIFLQNSAGTIIHSVNYSDAWYGNELKKDGGWTLEMIDTHNPCVGAANWKASVDPRGGTPGHINSVDAVNPDQQSPHLLRAYAPDSVTVVLVFDEPVDSTNASNVAQYSISDNIGNPVSALAMRYGFDQIQLNLSAAQALLRNKIYTVTVVGTTDCSGNAVQTPASARVGLYEHLDSLDVVLNEILFNPRPTSNDYVEVYNRSGKIINLRNLYLANRSSTGQVSSITQVTSGDYLLFPGDFMVFTESKALVLAEYVALNPSQFLEVNMPSFNDDKSNVILLNEQGNIVDELAYNEKWHFKLISNREGVALERTNYDAATQDEKNWHSAATSVGYGTPTYKNSQFTANGAVEGEITVTPEIVSPDNDGMDDYATISYQFPQPGYVANITIFDAAGRLVRYLQRNALCGLNGYFRWDGLGEKNQKLPVGMYIIYTEVFNLEGKTKKFKNVIVLARRNG